MLILAIDTSGRNGGVALVRGDAESFEVIASASLDGRTYSEQLVPQIADLLQSNNLTVEQLDGFAVAAGPGSFTGLRVGLATVKGLAEVTNKPIAAVSVLETVAVSAADGGESEPIIAALDAGRGEIYTAEYQVHGRSCKLVREVMLKREEFIAAVRGEAKGAVGPIATPDDGIAAFAQAAGLRVLRVEMPRVADIARLGLSKLIAGQSVSASDLDANYIRRADAEMWAPKPGAETPRPGANKA